MVNRCCIVPQCTSTSTTTPDKLFVSVPTDPKRRKKWLSLARRDPKSLKPNSSVSMCEDHFNMEKDIANYLKYKMGFSQKLLLVDGALPSKFNCQEDRRRRLCGAGIMRKAFEKRQRIDLIKECEKEYLQSEENIINTPVQRDSGMQQTIKVEPEELPKSQGIETNTDAIVTTEKSIQVAVKVRHKNKSTQTIFPKKKQIGIYPFKVPITSIYTFPF